MRKLSHDKQINVIVWLGIACFIFAFLSMPALFLILFGCFCFKMAYDLDKEEKGGRVAERLRLGLNVPTDEQILEALDCANIMTETQDSAHRIGKMKEGK